MDKKTKLKFMRLFYRNGYRVKWAFGSEIPVPDPLPKDTIKIESPSLSIFVLPDQNSCELYFTDAKQKKTWIYRSNGSDAKLIEAD